MNREDKVALAVKNIQASLIFLARLFVSLRFDRIYDIGETAQIYHIADFFGGTLSGLVGSAGSAACGCGL